MAVHKRQIRSWARLHGYLIYKTFLARTARWNAEARSAYVFNRLRRVLISAYDHIPFYRERFGDAGFNPHRHFKTANDISRAPYLTKADVRAHFERMLDRRFLFRSVLAHTSGTSGEPMVMRLDEPYVAFDYACMFRHWANAGYCFRSRILALRSYVPDTADSPLWRYEALQNTLFMSAYHLRPDNCQQYLDQIVRFRPAFIRAYPSSVNVLAEYAYPWREQLRFIKGIFTASETLLDSERQNIERTFGPVVYDWYGMTEPAVVITERPDHDGMEVNWEYGFPEFQLASELAPDERLLVTTSLHNPVMPFIRYQTGDVITIDAAAPSDSLLYPRIRRVKGRKDDVFVAPDGRRLPSVNFYSLLQGYSEILRFQFIQERTNSVVVKVHARAQPIPGALEATLREEIQRRLGPGVAVRIEFTDTFLTSPDGKSPTFVRLSQAAHTANAA